MPRPRKTSEPVLAKIFRCVYADGMAIKDVAQAYNLNLKYCYKLLAAKARCKVTGPLLAKYQPSGVKS
jgi:transposase